MENKYFKFYLYFINKLYLIIYFIKINFYMNSTINNFCFIYYYLYFNIDFINLFNQSLPIIIDNFSVITLHFYYKFFVIIRSFLSQILMNLIKNYFFIDYYPKFKNFHYYLLTKNFLNFCLNSKYQIIYSIFNYLFILIIIYNYLNLQASKSFDFILNLIFIFMKFTYIIVY